MTRLFFKPEDPKDLAEKMKLCSENSGLCRQMGQVGREKAIREYTEGVHYSRLSAVYERAIEAHRARWTQKVKDSER